MDNRSLIVRGLEELEIPFTEEDADLLCRYAEEIELWNRKYNLVKASGKDLVVDHILDSIAPVKHLEKISSRSVCDAGSGAGLPGIPLSILLKDKAFTLVERSAKRASFLNNTLAVLGLRERVRVIEGEVEDVSGPFDLITFRAFRQLDQYYSVLANLLDEGGVLFAYKGRRSVIDEELKTLPFKAETQVIRITVPFSSKERHVVILRPYR